MKLTFVNFLFFPVSRYFCLTGWAKPTVFNRCQTRNCEAKSLLIRQTDVLDEEKWRFR